MRFWFFCLLMVQRKKRENSSQCGTIGVAAFQGRRVPLLYRYPEPDLLSFGSNRSPYQMGRLVND